MVGESLVQPLLMKLRAFVVRKIKCFYIMTQTNEKRLVKLSCIQDNKPNVLLSSSQLVKKDELEQCVIKGIEQGKRGFMAAANALIEIEQLGLWRNESNSFDNYRTKFRQLLGDTDVSERHIMRLIAASKVNLSLRPIGHKIEKESHARSLAVLKEPLQIQRAYVRAVAIAEEVGEPIKAEHIQKAVEEIKPVGMRARKQPRPQIGANVRVTDSYVVTDMCGKEGFVYSHYDSESCVVRFVDTATELILPDIVLEVIATVCSSSVKEEVDQAASQVGLNAKSPMPDVGRNEGMRSEAESDRIALILASVKKDTKIMTQQEKIVLFEHLLKEVDFGMLSLGVLSQLESKLDNSKVT